MLLKGVSKKSESLVNVQVVAQILRGKSFHTCGAE